MPVVLFRGVRADRYRLAILPSRSGLWRGEGSLLPFLQVGLSE
jgi:hypothetical protein